MSNWINQVRARLNCRDKGLSSFQFRHFKLAAEIERLLERDANILDVVSGSPNFSLLWVYNQIKCGNVLDGNTIANAEALVVEKRNALDALAPTTVYASGTAATLSAVSALLNFGTTDPTITLAKAGRYLLSGRVQYQFSAADFSASRSVVSKLRRTNNTAADVSNSSSTIPTGIVTAATGLLAIVTLPDVVYETENDNDVISLFGSVSVVPDAGDLIATEASIIATRI